LPKNPTTLKPSTPLEQPNKSYQDSTDILDLLVIGAGPAGLTAAGRAGSLGARVLVFEKNREPGKKLIISGGGRCNVTNAEVDIHRLVQRYGKEGKRLFSVLSGFTPSHCIDFFQTQKVPVKIETEQRAFPADNKSHSIRDALVRYCEHNGVEILTQTPVKEIQGVLGSTMLDHIEVANNSKDSKHTSSESPKIWRVTTSRGQSYYGRSLLLATGGFARPETGSTGDGFGWLETLGHTIQHPEPILVPIRVSDPGHDKLMGLSSQDWGFSAYDPTGTKVISARGKILFTHFGLSGPLVLNHSLQIQELGKLWDKHSGQTQSSSNLSQKTKKYSSGFQLFVDFFPGTDHGTLDRQLVELIQGSSRKNLDTLLAVLIPPRLVSQILSTVNIPGDLKAAQLSKDQRKTIIQYLKAFPRRYSGRLGNDKAIVSRGGVDLDQVNFKTMESLVCSGLFLAGDILDFDRPSGGFSLQICWSTGWRVGEVVGSRINTKTGSKLDTKVSTG
jgi:predicted flavoprotein YhiN